MATARSLKTPLIALSTGVTVAVAVVSFLSIMSLRQQTARERLESVTAQAPLDTAAARRLTLIALGSPLRAEEAVTTPSLSIVQALALEGRSDAEGALSLALEAARRLETSGILDPTEITAVIALRKQSQAYNDALTARAERSLRITQMREQLKKERQQLQLMIEDTGDFFSIKALEDAPGSGPLPTYSEGALQGLPVLQNVPDGISDLADLRSQLEAAGGSLPLLSTDEVSARLQGIRSAVGDANANILSLEDDLAQTEEASQRGAEALTQIAQAWRKACQGVLLQLSHARSIKIGPLLQ